MIKISIIPPKFGQIVGLIPLGQSVGEGEQGLGVVSLGKGLLHILMGVGGTVIVGEQFGEAAALNEPVVLPRDIQHDDKIVGAQAHLFRLFHGVVAQVGFSIVAGDAADDHTHGAVQRAVVALQLLDAGGAEHPGLVRDEPRGVLGGGNVSAAAGSAGQADAHRQDDHHDGEQDGHAGSFE